MSSLSYNRAALRAEIGFYLGWGRDPSVWVDDNAYMAETVEADLKSGIHEACFPQPAGEGEPAHQWSFLTVSAPLSIAAPYSTGTVTVTNGSTTVTLADGVFPTDTASRVIIIRGQPYEIAARVDADEITLAAAYPGESESGVAYSVSFWDVELPANFGHFDGSLFFPPNENRPPIRVTSEGAILQARRSGLLGGDPQFVCQRASSTAPGAAEQTFIASFDRPPAAATLLTYRYFVLPEALVDSNYPYGGPGFAELVLASCLAAAEYRNHDRRGEKFDAYQRRLRAAIDLDSRRGADTLGINGDGGFTGQFSSRHDSPRRFQSFPNLNLP